MYNLYIYLGGKKKTMVLNGRLSMSGRLTSQKQITKSMNPFNLKI